MLRFRPGLRIGREALRSKTQTEQLLSVQYWVDNLLKTPYPSITQKCRSISFGLDPSVYYLNLEYGFRLITANQIGPGDHNAYRNGLH